VLRPRGTLFKSSMPTFEKRTHINASPERVFSFHERGDALERLLPPWEKARVLYKTQGIDVGARVVVEMTLGPIKQQIEALHTAYEKGRMFQDTMVRGPFAKWVHTHRMEPDGAGGSFLVDHIDYDLPLGILGAIGGAIGGGWFVRRKLERMFAYRHEVTRTACEEGW